MKIETYLDLQSEKIDRALLRYLPEKNQYPPILHEAMRYCVFPGGKRIRSILVLAACQALGGNMKRVMPSACALELIHCYSLIHDDLPCMDNDDWRRGKPSCHKKYDEATALLTGNALLTIAFKILSENQSSFRWNPKDCLCVIHMISEAIGVGGMLGGQMVDIEYKSKEMDLPALDYIHTHKTGALIAVSVKVGALLAGGTKKQVEALYRYGKDIGLLFQIVDDIIDQEGYASFMGFEEARKKAFNLVEKAKAHLKIFGSDADNLKNLACFLVSRIKSKT